MLQPAIQPMDFDALLRAQPAMDANTPVAEGYDIIVGVLPQHLQEEHSALHQIALKAKDAHDATRQVEKEILGLRIFGIKIKDGQREDLSNKLGRAQKELEAVEASFEPRLHAFKERVWNAHPTISRKHPLVIREGWKVGHSTAPPLTIMMFSF